MEVEEMRAARIGRRAVVGLAVEANVSLVVLRVLRQVAEPARGWDIPRSASADACRTDGSIVVMEWRGVWERDGVRRWCV